MAGQFTRRHLFTSPTVSISDVRCRPTTCDHQPEEATESGRIVFTRAGVFVKHVGGRDIVADANHVLFFNPQEPYRVSHPVPTGDDCTVYNFAPHILRDAWRSRDPSVVDRPNRPFRSTDCVCDAATVLRQQRLRMFLGQCGADSNDSGAIDALAAEELAFDLLAGLVNSDRQGEGTCPRRRRADTVIAHRDQVHAAKALLAVRFRERLSLDDVARCVHSSPYHLARVFRREVGLPIHQYVNRLRLRAALETLTEASRDLTWLALEIGYASHSHFTNAFRREFHQSPSDFRRSISGPALRKMSKNLQV